MPHDDVIAGTTRSSEDRRRTRRILATGRELVRRAAARATITRARSSRRCGAARASPGDSGSGGL